MSHMSKVFPGLTAQVALDLFSRPPKLKRSTDEELFWSQGQEMIFESGCRGRFFKAGQQVAVLIHGWASSGVKFQTLIKSLLEKNISCLAWDGPAHGDSPGKKTNLVSFTKILSSDLQAAKLNPDFLIGHSFGGSSAFLAYKFGLNPKKIVVIASPSSIANIFEVYFQITKVSKKTQKIAIEKIQNRIGLTISEISSENFVQEVPAKILLIHDEKDKEIHVNEARKLKQLRPNIEYFETSGWGHRRILANAKVHEKIAEFLMNP